MIDLDTLDFHSLESRNHPGLVTVSRLEDFIRKDVKTAVSPARIADYCRAKKILVTQFDLGAARGPIKCVPLDKCKIIAAGIRKQNLAALPELVEPPRPVVAQAALPLQSSLLQDEAVVSLESIDSKLDRILALLVK